MKPVIAVVNETTLLSDAQVVQWMAAQQKQVSNELAAEWGTDAELVYFPKGHKVPSAAWVLGLLATSDQADALGYHEMTARGLPLAKVFVQTTLSDGGLWQVTASHETCEMLVDRNINRVATVESGNKIRCYALESSDAVEADELGYKIDSVPLSDFVTQEWFDPNVTHTKATSFKGHVHGAFTLAPGGYISYLDAAEGQGWQQQTAKAADAPHRGSNRHALRHSGRHTWRHSTAHAEAA